MKKVLVALMFLNTIIIYTQTPILNVKGKDSAKVKLKELIVNVKIVGNIAYTTTEIHFFNSGNTAMEAELLFPLPEGVSVSKYAIDINGKMRDAVPVNKTKGKQVFESIIHKRVDPGLLEKVDGNNFKTRIYPIFPNNKRIVIIGYEEELTFADKNNLSYQLFSSYTKKLENFELNVKVLGTNLVPTINDIALEKNLDIKWEQSYQTSIKKSNYLPAEKITLKIPISAEVSSVMVQSNKDMHYFYANTFIENNRKIKSNPKSVGLIWDISLSCKNRNLKKELQLLDAYFKKLQNVKVTLYLLGYEYTKEAVFVITNGEWNILKSKLENTIYDGGTRFSKLNLGDNDEYLFFSDGISTLSNNQIDKIRKPIYSITSLSSSDYSFLNYLAIQSKGNFINLNTLSVEKGLDKLMFQNLKFLGIKNNFSVTEIYPMVGTSVSGNFSFSGISLNPQNEITLLFGYDENAIIEKTITIDSKIQTSTDINIEKIWAQKKIANLEIQYKKNADEIESLGKKYGIVTQNTSLIVLENINDYILYDIVPPTELRAEYDKILKQQRANLVAEQKNNWKNVEDYFNVLHNWWNKNLKYKKPQPVKIVKTKNYTKTNRNNRNNNVASSRQANGIISGIVSDNSGLLPGANIKVVGTNRETTTGFDGKFTIYANIGEVIQVSYMGFNSKTFNVENKNVYNIQMQEESTQLSEVVVTGYGVKRENRVANSTQVVRANLIQASVKNLNDSENKNEEMKSLTDKKIASQNVVQSLSGEIKGIQILNKDILSNQDTNNFENSISQSNSIKTKSWNPDRIYLKILNDSPIDKKYEVYLQLRESNLNNPSFYFDVANYFYNINFKEKALLVLSNIADLGLENHQLYKSLTYQFRQWEAYNDALFTASQVAKWRSFEPQSFRDLALTLEDNKHYQTAFDTLIKALNVNYYENMSGHYSGIEDIILMDINRMITEHPSIKTSNLDKKYLQKMPVGVRIILNWNQMDTDIDLHIVDPINEECYYGHKNTEIGASFSKDFTQGYGPEQYLLRNIMKGKYQIKTNFYGESALTENGPTTVMVEIYINKKGKIERKLKTIQLGKIKGNENLAEIMID